MRTCWQQLGNFRSVGMFLKRNYKKAVYVNYYNGKLTFGNDASGNELQILADKHLAYLHTSPNYCKKDMTLGVNGTFNRMCSRNIKKEYETSSERKSCRHLCKHCGYRVKKRTVKIRTSCRCEFHWCCTENCDTCIENRTLYFCSFA